MPVITNFGVPVNGNDGTTLMPKLQYRFRVSFIKMGTTKDTGHVTQNVISVSRPNLTHEEVVVDSYNSKMYLAGKHTWDTVSIVLRDDVDSVVLRELNNQLNRQVDHANQSSPRAGASYKFQTIMETLDGASPTPGVLDKFELAGCYIANISYGDMAYASSDQVQVTVGIRYDNAEIFDAAGNATLTGADLDQTVSNATGGGTQA